MRRRRLQGQGMGVGGSVWLLGALGQLPPLLMVTGTERWADRRRAKLARLSSQQRMQGTA